MAHHVHRVEVTPEATAVLTVAIREEEYRRTQRDDAARDLWVRFVESVCKVAMIQAIADAPTAPVISGAHAAWAADLVRWCIGNAAHMIRSRVADSPHERLAKRDLFGGQRKATWQA